MVYTKIVSSTRIPVQSESLHDLAVAGVSAPTSACHLMASAMQISHSVSRGENKVSLSMSRNENKVSHSVFWNENNVSHPVSRNENKVSHSVFWNENKVSHLVSRNENIDVCSVWSQYGDFRVTATSRVPDHHSPLPTIWETCTWLPRSYSGLFYERHRDSEDN